MFDYGVVMRETCEIVMFDYGVVLRETYEIVMFDMYHDRNISAVM
jgi:hypothetical protein